MHIYNYTLFYAKSARDHVLFVCAHAHISCVRVCVNNVYTPTRNTQLSKSTKYVLQVELESDCCLMTGIP